MKTIRQFWSHLAQFFSEWKMFQTKIVEKLETHICVQFFFFRKSGRLWDNVEKYSTVGQATDDNIAQAHSMLDTKGYKHTLRICNTYYFSTATVVARKASMLRYTCIAWQRNENLTSI